MMLFLALLLVGQADAMVARAPEASHISPPLKDVASDKKFFGPNGDYAQDTRPVVQKSVMDKLKGPDQPYPALQSKKDFDTDYVKDENSDSGTWKAQFEYDALRRKLAKEQAQEGLAESKADKEGRDVDDAKKKADAASNAADEAKKGADDAKAGEGANADGAEEAAPSKEALEELKKKVEEAKANLEKEEKDFENCQKQLEESKKNLEELKAKQAEMEKKLDGETKLWAQKVSQSKTIKLKLRAAKDEAHRTKQSAAVARLQVAQNNKAEVDKVLAREKAENERAQQNLRKEKAELEQAKTDMAKATARLQKLRGYTPADQALPKSGAAVKSAFAFLAFVAVQALA